MDSPTPPPGTRYMVRPLRRGPTTSSSVSPACFQNMHPKGTIPCPLPTPGFALMHVFRKPIYAARCRCSSCPGCQESHGRNAPVSSAHAPSSATRPSRTPWHACAVSAGRGSSLGSAPRRGRLGRTHRGFCGILALHSPKRPRGQVTSFDTTWYRQP